MNSWNTLSEPEFTLTLQYPSVTPDGHPVEVRRPQTGEQGRRVHLISPNSEELYFEVGRYLELIPQEAYAQFTHDVAERIKDVAFSALEPYTIAGRPGFIFSIHWLHHQRIILLIPAADALYRIIYDPASPLNEEVLETVRF